MDKKEMREKKYSFWQDWRHASILLMVYDAFIVNGAYFIALWLRFDFRYQQIPYDFLMNWAKFIPVYTIFCLVIFSLFHLYGSIWSFASYIEMRNLMLTAAITGLAHAAGMLLLFGIMPVSYFILGCIFQFLFVSGIRFSFRFINIFRDRSALRSEAPAMTRCMLIGAGEAGRIILRDLRYAKETKDRILCIIDDDPQKQGRYVEGVQVVGGREDILLNVQKFNIDKILIAIPTANMEDKREIYNICKESGCILMHLPSVYYPSEGDLTGAYSLKEVNIEDLLGREPIRVEMEEIYNSLKDKVILVTGGGGSIGSELCRQIAGHNPRKLIIFDIYENNAYEIEQELKREHRYLDFVVEIGSVRDSRRLYQLFSTYRPDIVYHAAAHKHVPLMEGNPCEAIKNNVFGTYKTAYAAMRFGCQRFVLVSTDKAVNPTNVMGASKRICEMIIQAFDRKIRSGCGAELKELHTHGEDAQFRTEDEVRGPEAAAVRAESEDRPCHTEFVAVRFGNVLGSNGSVVPLFKRMIARGGPVEVTHKDITRYFMTIPEAVSLILQAGTYARGGEIFVLDMGEPVKIDTLARNLIKLSGLVPDKDIQIVYTGLRPGEKLYEEKLMAEEGMLTTPNKLIHIGKPIDFDENLFLKELPDLLESAYCNDNRIRTQVKHLVPTYTWRETT